MLFDVGFEFDVFLFTFIHELFSYFNAIRFTVLYRVSQE